MFASVVAFQDPSTIYGGGDQVTTASEIIRQLFESENGGILVVSFCLAMSIAFSSATTTTTKDEVEVMAAVEADDAAAPAPTAFINSKNGSMFGLPI